MFKSVFQNAIPKAASFAAFFVFPIIWGLSIQAAKPETYKDIIEKAQNLSLQRDRPQAMSLLVSAIKKESKKSSAPKELFAALDEISFIFFSDKAQQSYELALSLAQSNPQLAATKLAEALRIEPENFAVQLEQARQLITVDCGQGATAVQKLAELNPFSEYILLAQAQAYLCNSDLENYVATKSITGEPRRSELSMFWTELEIEYSYKTGQLKKVRDLLNQARKVNVDYPEMYYWSWKMDVDAKLKSEKTGQKYISMCKNLSTRDQRRFRLNPRICRHAADVEAFLKKSANGDA